MIAEKDIDAARDAMVDELVQRRIVSTPAVERAFRRIHRHAFLPQPFALPVDPLASDYEETTDARRVYGGDTLVALNRAKKIHCGTPRVVAEQIERLAPAEGMRVLHVGSGSGYYTAIVAELVGERGTVVGVEFEEDLAALSRAFLGGAGYTTVTIVEGDGAFGVPEAAPFDRILVSAGAADIAGAWIAQLADDGRLVFPFCQVGPLGPQVSGGVILTIDKHDRSLFGEIASVAFFVPLHGALAPMPNEGTNVAEGLQRWFALEEFLRTDLPIRVALKTSLAQQPDPASVPWMLETRTAVMWIEPN